MIICGISDIHGNLYNAIPECDVLCICGDIIPLNIQRSMDASATWWSIRFIKWVESLKCKKVIVVPGNHDFYLEHLSIDKNKWKEYRDTMRVVTKDKVEFLIDEAYTYDNITFYGCPWINPISFQKNKWAFEYPSDEVEENPFKKIPKCDILLTHDNPNYNDLLYQECFGKYRHHLFGHWHDGISYGHLRQYNCSILNDNYNFRKRTEIVTFSVTEKEEQIREDDIPWETNLNIVE